MATRVNDLDRGSDGKGKSDGKESRGLTLAAAITARGRRPAVPRRSGSVPTALTQGSSPPIEPMFGNPFLGTEPLRSQSTGSLPPNHPPPVPLLRRIACFRHLRTPRRFGEFLKAHASRVSPHTRCAGCNGHELKADGLSSRQIAAKLQQEGMRSAKGKAPTAEVVRRWLSRCGLTTSTSMSPEEKESSEWTIAEIAHRFQLPLSTIHGWIHRGWLVARRLPDPRPRWVITSSVAELQKLTHDRTHRHRRIDEDRQEALPSR